MAQGAHLAVGENLSHGVFRGGALFALVSACQMRDVIRGMVITDVLQRCGHRLDQILLLNDAHGFKRSG